MTNWSSDSKQSTNWKPESSIGAGTPMGLLLALTYAIDISTKKTTDWTPEIKS